MIVFFVCHQLLLKQKNHRSSTQYIFIFSLKLSCIRSCNIYLPYIRNQFAHDTVIQKEVVRCKYIFLLFVTEAGELWEHLRMEAIHVMFSFELYNPAFKCKVSIRFFLKLVFYPCTFPNYPIQKTIYRSFNFLICSKSLLSRCRFNAEQGYIIFST